MHLTQHSMWFIRPMQTHVLHLWALSVDFGNIKSDSTCATIWILIWKLPAAPCNNFTWFAMAKLVTFHFHISLAVACLLQPSESKLCTRINGFPFNQLIALKCIQHKRTMAPLTERRDYMLLSREIKTGNLVGIVRFKISGAKSARKRREFV